MEAFLKPCLQWTWSLESWLSLQRGQPCGASRTRQEALGAKSMASWGCDWLHHTLGQDTYAGRPEPPPTSGPHLLQSQQQLQEGNEQHQGMGGGQGPGISPASPTEPSEKGMEWSRKEHTPGSSLQPGKPWLL